MSMISAPFWPVRCKMWSIYTERKTESVLDNRDALYLLIAVSTYCYSDSASGSIRSISASRSSSNRFMFLLGVI